MTIECVGIIDRTLDTAEGLHRIGIRDQATSYTDVSRVGTIATIRIW